MSVSRRCSRRRLVVSHEGRQLPRPGLRVLLELLHPPVVGLDGVLEDGVLQSGRLFVELNTPGTVQPLEVDVAFPSNANAIQNERGFDVNLEILINME